MTSYGVEEVVLSAIDQEYLADRVMTKLGWVCLKNEDYEIGPKYLISFNYPTESNEYSYIEQFIRTADPDLVRDFYRRCNGLSIFGDAFVVPGVRFDTGTLDGLDYFNIPIDFMVLGGIDLPEHCPVEGFQIGESHLSIHGNTKKIYDVVDSKGRIISGLFDESDVVSELFTEVPQWLEKRIVDAQKAFAQTFRV